MTLAPYACLPDQSRGRLYPEEHCPLRSPYERDRDRVIHSAAFRRLEYKTQVFVNHEGDHYRTRLTHSLEVAHIARHVARLLRVNDALTETLALSHDLGHTPFGHAGEDGLNVAMAPYGGFDHNAQTIKIVTSLESRYALFNGLNLTWETLEGLAKHNGPVEAKHLPFSLREYNLKHDLELHTYASVEAQVASLADDIAYNNHDIEDGIRAELFTLEDLRIIPWIAETLNSVDDTYGPLPHSKRLHELRRRLIRGMIEDLVHHSQKTIAEANPTSVDAVRHLGKPVVSFSPAMQEYHLQIRAFLKERMYRHYRVNRMASKAKRIVQALFTFFLTETECLPTTWQQMVSAQEDLVHKAHTVADFIAGMTDRFAYEEYQRITDMSCKG